MAHKKAPVSRIKARLILHEGMARGKKLTSRQRGFFGAISSGRLGHKKGR